MNINGKSTRFHERTKLTIPVQVFYSETADSEWSEIAVTEEITICGVGFTLARPVELSRLIRLKLAMPKKFRLFDFGKEFYEVWAIICDVQMDQSEIENQISLKIGAALIGAKPPSSFFDKPETLYDLKPVLRDRNFWGVRELPRKTGPFRRSFEERRAIIIKLQLEIIDKMGKIIESLEAETVNISESGMAILTELKIINPKYVLIKFQDETAPLFAVVRGIQESDLSDFSRLHLEFISGKWSFD